MKTFVMTIGEFEYDRIFNGDQDKAEEKRSYEVLAYTLWLIFLIIMPILLMNLLVRSFGT